MSERPPIANLPPLSGVQDPAVRAYLEALSQAWLVRNGQTRETDERFLTLADLRDGFAQAGRGAGGNLGFGSSNNILTANIIASAIQSLADDIKQSRLWKQLGERIEQLEVPEWFRQRFNMEIRNEVIQRESADESLQHKIQTTHAQLDGSLAIVRSDIQTLVNHDQALAQQITTVATTFDGKFSGVETRLVSLTSQAEATASQLTTTRAEFNNNIAGVRSDLTSVANNVNSVARRLDQTISDHGGRIAQTESRLQSVSDQAGATASQVTTLQTRVSQTDARAQQALTMGQNIDGQVKGAWTVKFDANGYVTGAGLGLEGKNGIYSSEFTVRADRFSIGAPVNPEAMADADVPFIVTTVPRVIGGVTYPPGTWIKTAYIADASIGNAKIADAAITSAKIGDAEIGTLKIAGQAVTVPVGASGYGYVPVLNIYMSHAGKIAVFAMANWLANLGASGGGFLSATCDGNAGPEVGVSALGGYSCSATAFATFDVGAGAHTVSFNQRAVDMPGFVPSTSRYLGAVGLFAIGIKR